MAKAFSMTQDTFLNNNERFNSHFMLAGSFDNSNERMRIPDVIVKKLK